MKSSLEICVSLYGVEKITLLYALLASIMRLYGGEKDVAVHLILQDIPESIIEEIRKKVKLDLRITKYTDPIGRDKISGKMRLWKILVDRAVKDNILLLDADTVLVRDVKHFFNKEFDVGFTYKTDEDENLAWPINTGVILLRNNNSGKAFFICFVNLTREYVLDCKGETRRLKRWGALDQAAFGHLLLTRSPKTFGSGIRIGDCFIKGFTCTVLNETRCVSMIYCHIVHYKGWFQKVVLSGEYNQHRPEEKCKCMKSFWDSLQRVWEVL